MSLLVKKICLIGAEGVGKSSLIRRFVDNSFDDEYRSTIGVQINQKIVELSPTKKAELIIWDLEGFDISTDYPLSYLMGTSTCIFVADISRPNTISELASIYPKIMSNFKLPISPVIALNKIDLAPADSHSIELNKLKTSSIYNEVTDFHLTSAKLGDSVEDVFKSVAKNIYND